jgi:hypothetical protein
MPKADKATIKITERRKSLGFMIQVRLIREFFISPADFSWSKALMSFQLKRRLAADDFSSESTI